MEEEEGEKAPGRGEFTTSIEEVRLLVQRIWGPGAVRFLAADELLNRWGQLRALVACGKQTKEGQGGFCRVVPGSCLPVPPEQVIVQRLPRQIRGECMAEQEEGQQGVTHGSVRRRVR